MRSKKPLQLRSWALPFLVGALILPAVLGFRIAGPPLGVAIGAISVAFLIVFAANARFEEPIEVAQDDLGDRRYRVLLVLGHSPVDEPGAANGVAAIAEHGASPEGEEPEVLVLAPAVGSPVDRWLSDVGEARLEAQTRLALTVGTLAAAGIDSRGQVGDPDAVLAIEDALREFPAREVVFAAPDDRAIADVRKRLDRPVRSLS